MPNVALDVEGAQKQMNAGSPRFKVEKVGELFPVFLLRRPDDPKFCTIPITKHWYNDPRGEENAIIPCKRSLFANDPDYLDLVRDELVDNQAYYSLTKDNREFLEGSTAHDTQLIDLRDYTVLLQAYAAAMQSSDQATAGTTLAKLHKAILAEPVKTWSFSRTVYNMIMSQMITFRDTENAGTFRDPTDAARAHVLYVSKVKSGKGPARFQVQFGWSVPYSLPAELFADGRVKNYEDLLQGYRKQLAYWPTKRLQELCAYAGIPTGALVAADGPALTAQPGVPSLPPPPPTAPVPTTIAPPLVAVPPVTADTTIVEVPVIPTGTPAPAVEKSAEALACFGTAPNFEKQKCTECTRLNGCVAAMQARIKKPAAIANAPAIAPPTAVAVPEAPVGDRVDSMIDVALANAEKGE